MNRPASSTILILVAAIVLALSAPAAKAQVSQPPLVDVTGVDCLEYKLDVVTLKDNNHQMYWKQSDCIRIAVINNPFIYTYALEYDEKTIAEDDILGSLGSLFGLKSISSSNPTSTPKTQTPAPSPGPGNRAGPVHALRAVVATPKCTDPQQKELADLALKAEQLNSKVLMAEASLNDLKNAPRDLNATLDKKEQEYADFLKDYPARRQELVSNTTDADSLKRAALSLQSDSWKVVDSLTGDRRFESQMVDKFSAARLINNEFAELKKAASALESEVKSNAPQCIPQKPRDAEKSALQKQVADLQTKIDADTVGLELYASQIGNVGCKYKARKDGEFSWVFQQVYQPISAVLANPVAFGYSWYRRAAPKGDPTFVRITLKRDVIVDPAETSVPTADNSVFECASDPSKIFAADKSFASFDELPVTQAKAKNGEAAVAGKPTQSADPKKASADKTKSPTAVVLEQPFFFGRARLVLTGGLSSGFLGKQEFQRSTSITGTSSGATSSTVIGLKTDTRFRLTPMLYGHTLLYSGRHDPDAWYATFGVTANSDNKGTSPEFLLGFSRSLVQQRCFFTLGAYIGERQKLDGGLHVGDTIPSTLTGELPVTKSYHVGWGFGLSYRFTSTKDPQKDSSAPAKQPAK